MATFVQTPSGTWKAVIRRRGWPTKIKTFRTKKLAEDWSRRAEDEMARGVYVDRSPSEKLLLSSALERYEREVTAAKQASTQVSEKRRISYLKKHFGPYAFAALTPQMIADYRDKRLSGEIKVGRNTKPGLRAGNTVRLELALLGHLYEVAIREWGIGAIQNPVRYVRKPKVGEHRQRRLNPKEERALFDELRRHSNPMLLWIAVIGLETGMRSSEISALRLAQVDLDQRVVTLHTTKNKRPREVPLSMIARQTFKQALANPARPAEVDLVFFGEPGKDETRRPYQFNKVWQEAKARAGLKDFRFHDLRHEAGSRLAEGGMDSRKISAVLGHLDPKMAMVYVNLYGSDLVDEVDEALLKRRSRRLVGGTRQGAIA